MPLKPKRTIYVDVGDEAGLEEIPGRLGGISSTFHAHGKEGLLTVWLLLVLDL